MVATHPICAARTIHDLARHLLRLHEVYTRPDDLAAARHRARGKLTIPEKLALLFGAGTFVEKSAPDPALDPRHGERRLVTGHGQMNQRIEPISVGSLDDILLAKILCHRSLFDEHRPRERTS